MWKLSREQLYEVLPDVRRHCVVVHPAEQTSAKPGQPGPVQEGSKGYTRPGEVQNLGRVDNIFLKWTDSLQRWWAAQNACTL